jgi:hypothetical protein
MNLFNFFIILLFSLSIFSNDIQINDFPVPDFSFLNNTFFLEDLVNIDSAKNNIIITSQKNPTREPKRNTGYTPQKGKKNLFSLDTPIKKNTHIRVKINKPGINYNCENIDSSTIKFKNYMSFIDPKFLNDPIIFNNEDIYWDNFVNDKFITNKNLFVNEEIFIESIINIIHENLHSIKENIIFDKNDNLVCRHFSVMALPIVSRLLQHPNSLFNDATIQLFSADFYNSQWQRRAGGHCWNILCLTKDNKKVFYYLDVLNKMYAELSVLDDDYRVIMCSIKHDKSAVIDRKNDFYCYVYNSLLRLGIVKKDCLELDKKNLPIAAKKALVKFNTQKYYEINL